MQLIAFVKRRPDLSRAEFLAHWHGVHGPLIRDTPGLGGRLLRYEQHPARDDDRSGFDGVAIQEFASWDDFLAMLDDPAAEAMRVDESNFLDQAATKVVFTDDPVVVVGGAS